MMDTSRPQLIHPPPTTQNTKRTKRTYRYHCCSHDDPGGPVAIDTNVQQHRKGRQRDSTAWLW